MDARVKAHYLKEKLTEIFKGKKNKTLLFVGIAGMTLIMLSSVVPTAEKKNPVMGGDPAQAASADEYIAQMEKRLTELVSNVEGVGRCQVMVTAESGVEYVYAIEESENLNETNNYEGDEVKRQTQQQNKEQKYIVVDAGSGKKEALIKTQKQPSIQGVVVICEGAENMVVQERVTQVVTTALGIPYNKVCVTTISK